LQFYKNNKFYFTIPLRYFSLSNIKNF